MRTVKIEDHAIGLVRPHEQAHAGGASQPELLVERIHVQPLRLARNPVLDVALHMRQGMLGLAILEGGKHSAIHVHCR